MIIGKMKDILGHFNLRKYVSGEVKRKYFIHILLNWPYLEAEVKNWITDYKNKRVILVGQLLGVTVMKRHGL
jgi:hypothetical protein